jgi:hypothetical protein
MQVIALIRQNRNTSSSFVVILILFALSTLAILSAAWRRKDGPPTLFDPIPCVYNTIQFVRNNERFLDRASYVDIMHFAIYIIY